MVDVRLRTDGVSRLLPPTEPERGLNSGAVALDSGNGRLALKRHTGGAFIDEPPPIVDKNQG